MYYSMYMKVLTKIEEEKCACVYSWRFLPQYVNLFTRKKAEHKMELKRAGAKTDYLGGLAELLTILLLHLHQPGVALQQEGRGGV